MNTSAEASVSPDFVVVTRRYNHPDVVRLTADVQAEYVVRYGGPDATPVNPTQFDPPDGVFLVGEWDGVPVAMGGWRTQEAGGSSGNRVAEIKRMYVVQSARRHGFAAVILRALERTAAEAGFTRIVLETGQRQPEAIAMYERHSYLPVQPFGHYACQSGSIHLGKAL
jgi:GNAT superfamily N-acetyltransferase